MSIVTGRRLNMFYTQIKGVFLGKNDNAASATKATQDANGKAITDTYAKKSIYDDAAINFGRKDDTTSGPNSAVVGGADNTASKSYTATLGGRSNTASDVGSVIVGGEVGTASGRYSVVVGGSNNTISGNYSAILAGTYNTVNGASSAILGGASNTVDSTYSAILGGRRCTSQYNAVMMGHYNDTTKGAEATEASGTGTGTAFEIGNGTESTASNAMRADYNGKFWCKAAYSSSGADYAELFEWLDGNPDSEKRVGYFVTMSGKKIKKANRGDWILGIVSANPCVLGNSDMEWQGQFMKDEFGAYIIEHHKETVTEVEPVLDGEGNPVIDEETGKPATQEVEKEVEFDFYKVNPDYDPSEKYIDRLSRPEWDAAGMMGVLSIYDDGTCEVDGFCTCGHEGAATASEYGYRVIERVADNIIKVIINAESNSMVVNLMNKNTMLEDRIAKLEDKISRLEKAIIV